MSEIKFKLHTRLTTQSELPIQAQLRYRVWVDVESIMLGDFYIAIEDSLLEGLSSDTPDA